MIRAGIVGAAGYTAGELIRLLLNHPFAELVFAQSSSHAGEPLWTAHQDLIGDTDLKFCDGIPWNDADVVFLCSGHGKSRSVLSSLPSDCQASVIDLSNDFRLSETSEGFVYGLPEAFRSLYACDSENTSSHKVANPGCFATAIQLALLPMAAADKLGEVHITGVTGSTGAGQKPSETTHFSWRSSNLSVYKPFTHQHLDEIKETLHRLSPSFGGKVNFVPVRGDFTRGIMVSAYFDSDASEQEVIEIYKEYYKDEPFVQVVDFNPDLKMVVGTNKAVLYVRKYGDNVHVISMIDNLIKGASGTAVHNMNLIFGLPETSGLKLKALRF